MEMFGIRKENNKTGEGREGIKKGGEGEKPTRIREDHNYKGGKGEHK